MGSSEELANIDVLYCCGKSVSARMGQSGSANSFDNTGLFAEIAIEHLPAF
jgi:hypothetical protein